jgi:hypothetical protein
LTKRLLALLVVAAVLVGACTKNTNSANGPGSKPLDIYTAGPTVGEVRQLLGDTQWWLEPPTFWVRPLNAVDLPLSARFSITQRFTHVGTMEHLIVLYTAWTTTSAATTAMNNVQTSLGTSATGPKAGDQTFYYAQRDPSGSGLFLYLIFIRVGTVVIEADYTRSELLDSTAPLGKIATAIAGRLKDVLSGRLRSEPLSGADQALLPPPGNNVTLVGAAKMPVEAWAAFLPGAAPGQIISAFTDVGVKDFLFGDYALDSDIRMEVRATEFTFADQQQATTWLYKLVSPSNLDSNGVASAYEAAAREYIWLFTSGNHGAMILCSSAVAGEAASRACETPVDAVVSDWRQSLSRA